MGRLGTALGSALEAAGYAPLLLHARDATSGRQARGELPGSLTDADTLIARCALVFLTVPDAVLAEVAAAYPWRAGQRVVHCSGALGLDVLSAAKQRGAAVGCFHPLQTFPAGLPAADAPARFQGIVCGIEGDEAVRHWLEALASDLGARGVSLHGVDRATYHAAAVLAGNDVVALASAAARAWTLAGLPPEQAREALAPLIRASAEGIGAHPLADALTGPVARGDVATVERHLQALKRDPALLELYRQLAQELLRLNLKLSPEVRRALQRALEA